MRSGMTARALLLALTWAAAASAARYVDYSGVKMPAYGASDYDAPRDPAAAPPSADYRGHSPDAPAAPDYKFEEEPRSKFHRLHHCTLSIAAIRVVLQRYCVTQ